MCGPSEFYPISSATMAYVYARPGPEQSADRNRRHRGGGACGHGLSGFIASFFIQVRRSSLPMAKHADRRSRALVRVRLLLRIPGHLRHLTPVLAVRAFCVAGLARSGSRIFLRERVSVESYTENPTCWPSRFPSCFSPRSALTTEAIMKRVGIYLKVSTDSQTTENQRWEF
jgi:hypothetical protein